MYAVLYEREFTRARTHTSARTRPLLGLTRISTHMFLFLCEHELTEYVLPVLVDFLGWRQCCSELQCVAVFCTGAWAASSQHELTEYVPPVLVNSLGWREYIHGFIYVFLCKRELTEYVSPVLVNSLGWWVWKQTCLVGLFCGLVGRFADFRALSRFFSNLVHTHIQAPPVTTRTLQHTATHCNTLQHTATHTRSAFYNKDTATRHCNTLHQTATHCNAP